MDVNKDQEDWISEFQARATWQFPIKYLNLSQSLKKMAKKQGYSNNDEVLIQVDTVNGGYYVTPPNQGESIERCTSCGTSKLKCLDEYEIVYGKKKSEKVIYWSKQSATSEINLELTQYTLPICRSCVKKKQMKSLLLNIALIIGVPVVGFLMLINEANRNGSSTDYGTAFIPVVVILAIVFGIKGLLKIRNIKYHGMEMAKIIFEKVFPGGFPQGDRLFTLDEYQKEKFKK